MSFETNLILQRFVLPGVCSLIGCALLVRTDPGDECYKDEPVRGMAGQLLIGALFCGLGVVASDFWFRDLILKPMEWPTWKASYQWNWLVWMIPGAMLILASSRAWYSTPIHYVSIAAVLMWGLSIGIVFVSLNEGEIWQDQASKLMPWLAAALAAVSLNTFALNAIAKSGGVRWTPLVVLAQLGCVAAIALQAYGTLGEFALAGAATAAGASVVSLIKASSSKTHFGWQLAIVMLPLLILAVAVLAVSRFFESVQLPTWLLTAVLFLPTLAGLVDLVFGRLSHAWIRPVFAGSVCAGVLGWIVYLALSKPPEW